MINICKILIFMSVAVLLQACSNTKYLGPGENLYMGADIKVKSSVKLSKKNEKAIKSELSDLARPRPNSTALGIRYKLFIYNLAGKTTKKKGFKHWLKYSVGEPPVIASMAALNNNSTVFQDRLENRGYFHDTVTLDTTVRNKKLRAVYTAYVGSQYKIRHVTFPQSSDTLSVSINKHVKRSLLKPGSAYDLDTIKDERLRIDSRLKEHGFYFFNPGDLIVKIDSTVGNHLVDLNMQIKPLIPEDATRSYRINNITVYADYHANDTGRNGISAEYSNGYKIIDPRRKFRPSVFDKVLIFKKDSTYNVTSHNLALNRLVTLGTYKFVKARFEKSDTANGDYLDLFYYLTPFPKKSIRFTATALTKSNSASGGQLSVDLLYRNLFKGAEQFAITPYIGLEQQFSSLSKAGTRRGGIDLSLTTPRIISPFNFKVNGGFLPRTKMEIGYELFSSDTLYTLNSLYASYGYTWQQSVQKQATLNILNISYVRPTNITPAFATEIKEDNALFRSIEPQMIIGSSYNYNINTQIKRNNNRNNFYFNGNIDASGNLIGLFSGANANKGKVVNIFNVPVSQYIRLEADFRYYLKFDQNTILAYRFWGGFGYAYGNSTELPYVKSFFAGGTNDIRAFRSRGLGPGSYYTPDTARFVSDEPGDIKLEANVELRTKLFSVVKGALFVDMGNVWTLREDSSRPGSKFTGNFLNQIAVGAGAGLRFDFTILVLRVDVAYPLKKPYSYSVGPSQLVYNLAIGYPF